ncbi:pyruvate, water dikinase [Methylomarinovum tepidoasis]|uniref:Pyruvate, water dikinase n=1 Tax=Methylomarinovum tepidoasis TaxID=2840183 RepID=A0AAU9C9K6_9GAMM|nr:PEP/pyruvate-binding domain-containing protein [Methylomarinovum sp. IN45]BCX89115.1 pyruvate, water dikinase [Methylomarinovum sp. IN45]
MNIRPAAILAMAALSCPSPHAAAPADYHDSDATLTVPGVIAGQTAYCNVTLERLAEDRWQFALTELSVCDQTPEDGPVYDAATGTLQLPVTLAERPGAPRFQVRLTQVPGLGGIQFLVTEAYPENGDPGYRYLAETEGRLRLRNPEDFSQLAASAGIGGAEEVKFVITDIDTGHPLLHFQNSRRYSLHFDFVHDALGWYPELARDEAIARFNAVSYFSQGRRNLVGSVVHYPQNDRYALEFWPTDPVPVSGIRAAFRLLQQAMPFAADRLIYHPLGVTQETLAREHGDALAGDGIPLMFSTELFADTDSAVLNPGDSYGRLRLVRPGDPLPSARDVAIFTYVPNDLKRVAGIITETPQTTLSHINLRAKQDRRPNVYLRNAATRPDIAPLIGQWVHLHADADGIRLESASEAEAQNWLDGLRPTQVQVPEYDLSVTEPLPLTDIGFSDWRAFGVKAANVAELGKILPEGVAPDGYVLPFSLYDRFMALPRCGKAQTTLCPPGEHGPSFYDQVRALLADARFQDDPEYRSAQLKTLRKRIKKGEAPDDLIAAIEAVRRFWEPGGPPFHQSLRCRSSTNNEDLPGFNGAGLYRSTTHKADEGALIESVKKVWASLWNDGAFEERAFWRVDHLHTYMGVLIHPNYGDEQANGVAVSANLYNAGWPGFTVNAQYGEISVTNPKPLEIGGETVFPVPDEFLLVRLPGAESTDTWETLYLRHSNVTEVYGQPVSETVLRREEIAQLRHYLTLIHHHFKKRYGGEDDFAIEIEFKITETDDGSRGHLAIKQARPWIR